MNLAIRVGYPKRIEITAGTRIQIIGVFDQVDHIVATSIIDAERGIVFALHPSEITEVTPYRGTVPWSFPLFAQVVGSSQWGEHTILDVFPTGQTVYDFHQLSLPIAQAAAPAFWRLAEESQAWQQQFVPKGRSLLNWKQSRPQPIKAGHAVAAMRRYARFHTEFRVQQCERSVWKSVDKLLHLDRHLDRLKVIADWRRHLYLSSMSEGREIALGETRAETGITVEAAVTSLYSALDILGHAFNEFFGLGLSQSTVGFLSALTNKAPRVDDGDIQPRRCMETLFPDDPLTKYLLTQRQEWISEIEEWRHFVIHHGCLGTAEVRDGGVIVLIRRNDELDDIYIDFQEDAVTLVARWSIYLRELMTEAFRLIEERASCIAAEYEAQEKPDVPKGAIAPPDRDKATEVLLSFLELWKSDEKNEPKKYGHMYGRLTKNWQRAWPFDSFQRCIHNHPLLDYQVAGPFYSGSDASGRVHHMNMILAFPEGQRRWSFALVFVPQVGMAIDLTPFSVPTAFAQRIEVSGVAPRQSGKESGYRDMIVSGIVRNISTTTVYDVEVHIYMLELSFASMSLGILEAGQEVAFDAVWKDGCVPVLGDLPSAYADWGWVSIKRVRVTYEFNTDEGNLWAEDTMLR